MVAEPGLRMACMTGTKAKGRDSRLKAAARLVRASWISISVLGMLG
jgi:hypothetical protein